MKKMRDSVRLERLQRRPDLNGCYGLLQRKYDADVFEVRVGMENVLVSMHNLDFVADRMPPTFFSDYTDPLSQVDLRRVGLVLDRPMRLKYSPDEVVQVTCRDVRELAARSRESAVVWG